MATEVIESPAVTIDDLCAEVLARREKACRDDARISPQHVPRASSIGDCDLEMQKSIQEWEHKPLFEPWLLQRFRRGNEVERFVRGELNEIGLEIIDNQRTCKVEDRDGTLLCTAHIDGKIPWRGLSPVFECKSLNPNIWSRINSPEDFNQYHWARKYPRQLILYMYATNEPVGLFLIDDCLGHWKLLPMRIEDHLEEAERLLKRLRRVVDAIKNKVDLPFIDNPKICKECWRYKAGRCQPPMDFSQGGVHLIDDPELEELFEIIERTQSQGKAYEASVADAKEHFKARGPGEYLIGEWLVTTKKTGSGIRTTWSKVGEPEEV